MPTLDELDDHVPVPLPHTPNVRTIASTGFVGLVITSHGVGLGTEWIHAENPVEIKQ